MGQPADQPGAGAVRPVRSRCRSACLPASRRRYTATAGRTARSSSSLVAGLSIPNFAVATFLVYLLSANATCCRWQGGATLRRRCCRSWCSRMPAAAYIARLSRTFMLEVLQQDYIRTARAKGLSERLVIYRHALRNTLVPLITVTGIIFGGLLSNTVVVETLFNIPGLGRLAIDSIFARDYPVAMAIVLLFMLFYAAINLAGGPALRPGRSAHPQRVDGMSAGAGRRTHQRRTALSPAAALLSSTRRCGRGAHRSRWWCWSRCSRLAGAASLRRNRPAEHLGTTRCVRNLLGTDELGRDIAEPSDRRRAGLAYRRAVRGRHHAR